MVRDLSDPYDARRRQARDVRRLQASTAIQNTAVDRGALRVKSAEGLEVGTAEDPTGSQYVYGILRIIGQLTGSGTYNWSGTMNQTGATNLRGPVKITGENGTLEVDAETLLRGLTRVLDDLRVQSGGKIVIEGQNPITIATNSQGVAALSFQSGAQIASNQGAVVLSNSDGTVIGIGNGVVGIQADKIDVTKLPPLPAGTSSKYVVVGSDGILYEASNNGGGDPGTPGTPGDNPGGYIYPVNPSAWTLGDDFADHVARGSAEPGIDWWTSVGTPIWAPGDGTILAVQSAYTGATGAYVTLITDQGDWFRFLHLNTTSVSPGQTVSQGDVLAYSGGSGFGSPAGYGPHIHVSFKAGFTGTFPGSGLDDFIAYMATT